jgi:hypothetical protein
VPVISPHTFQRGPGLAFLHRLVLALHLSCVEVGACGMRLVCLLLKLTGRDRFVATSYGAQQQVNRHVEEAIVAYRQAETARLAKAMPRQDITLTQDATLTGGLCLVGSAPVSHCIILAQLAQARDQVTWNARMAPALAELNCQVRQSTSDEAPGLLAYVEPQLGAQHAPDLFHGQHELSKAVCAPMATTVRAVQNVVTEAQRTLDQGQAHLHTAGNEPPPIGSEHSPEAIVRREQAWQALDVASREHERLAPQREHVAKSLRAIGQAYHFVDLARGVRRNGQLMAHDLHA